MPGQVARREPPDEAGRPEQDEVQLPASTHPLILTRPTRGRNPRDPALDA
jgi:hypothetical protein